MWRFRNVKDGIRNDNHGARDKENTERICTQYR